MTDQQSRATDIKLEEHPDLRLTLEDAGPEGTVIVHQAGLIDTYNADFFRNQVTKVIEAGFRNVIIDSSATTFMSSCGIGAYTALLKSIRQSGGSLTIYGMPSKIYEVFQLLGFSSFFTFCSSKEEAIAMLSVDRVPRPAFPIQFSCPVCHKKLRAVRSGRFRCSSCKVILAVDKNADVHLG